MRPLVVAHILCVSASLSFGQEASNSGVPNLISYSGTIRDANAKCHALLADSWRDVRRLAAAAF